MNGPNKLGHYIALSSKSISETNTLAYFGTFESDEKSFVTLPPGAVFTTPRYLRILRMDLIS
jgi:hypothetical protein